MPLAKYFADSPGRTVLFSIFLTICIGTALLMLPAAQQVPLSLIDCFFTATSSTCVTGVLPIPFNSYTFFGKCVILALIQIGGIGLLTLWLFLVSVFTELGLSTSYMVSQILELTEFKNPRSILFFIIGLTLIVECIGAVGIYGLIAPYYSTHDAIFHAIFHSISSFCNAGLSSFGEQSLIAFQYHLPFLALTALLILLGGIGFMTLFEVLLFIKRKWQQKRFHFSLTAKVIVTMTSVLILSITLLLILLERDYFALDPWWIMVSNMLFNAIAYRSAGLTTINLDTMQTATVFMIIMYSFIGSSPVSTGSGVKVTTFALLLATIRSVIKGKMVVELKGRRIPQDQIFKAMAVLALGVCWIVGSTFILALTESTSDFMHIFFESVSSFTNLGLATNITPFLSVFGKLIIILNMFMGRVGTLTLMLALRVGRDRVEFKYPEERLMIS